MHFSVKVMVAALGGDSCDWPLQNMEIIGQRLLVSCCIVIIVMVGLSVS